MFKDIHSSSTCRGRPRRTRSRRRCRCRRCWGSRRGSGSPWSRTGWIVCTLHYQVRLMEACPLEFLNFYNDTFGKQPQQHPSLEYTTRKLRRYQCPNCGPLPPTWCTGARRSSLSWRTPCRRGARSWRRPWCTSGSRGPGTSRPATHQPHCSVSMVSWTVSWPDPKLVTGQWGK